ncbi:MAG: hypothetical protein Q9160_001180 [Pyrenula sp. 1 TL-2023]
MKEATIKGTKSLFRLDDDALAQETSSIKGKGKAPVRSSSPKGKEKASSEPPVYERKGKEPAERSPYQLKSSTANEPGHVAVSFPPDVNSSNRTSRSGTVSGEIRLSRARTSSLNRSRTRSRSSNATRPAPEPLRLQELRARPVPRPIPEPSPGPSFGSLSKTLPERKQPPPPRPLSEFQTLAPHEFEKILRHRIAVRENQRARESLIESEASRDSDAQNDRAAEGIDNGTHEPGPRQPNETKEPRGDKPANVISEPSSTEINQRTHDASDTTSHGATSEEPPEIEEFSDDKHATVAEDPSTAEESKRTPKVEEIFGDESANVVGGTSTTKSTHTSSSSARTVLSPSSPEVSSTSSRSLEVPANTSARLSPQSHSPAFSATPRRRTVRFVDEVEPSSSEPHASRNIYERGVCSPARRRFEHEHPHTYERASLSSGVAEAHTSSRGDAPPARTSLWGFQDWVRNHWNGEGTLRAVGQRDTPQSPGRPSVDTLCPEGETAPGHIDQSAPLPQQDSEPEGSSSDLQPIQGRDRLAEHVERFYPPWQRAGTRIVEGAREIEGIAEQLCMVWILLCLTFAAMLYRCLVIWADFFRYVFRFRR